MIDILIVDDQPYLCGLLPPVLGGENCHITCAGSTESVKRWLAHSTPDVVLLEISLHGFDGWDVLHYIKTENPHVLVLIVTSYDSYLNDPRACKADGYMIKDFIHLELLEEKITRTLASKGGPRKYCPQMGENTVFTLSPYRAQSVLHS
jgi:CheY-like chemotaxis protein